MKFKVEKFVSEKIREGKYPGCQVLVAQRGNVLVDLSLGSMISGSSRKDDQVTDNTLFNIESITKVLVTLPLAFKLIEDGKLHLDDRVAMYIPEFSDGSAKGKVTIRDLLNFTGGISSDDPIGCEEAAKIGDLNKSWNLHYSQDLIHEPGTKVLYSDVSCRILGQLLERVLETSLSEAAQSFFFKPLEMSHTMYNPLKSLCASTGISDSGRDLRGTLTQDLEHYLGEVLGSDGLFSNSHDMLMFSQMILNRGFCCDKRIMGKVTVENMTASVTNEGLFERPDSYLSYILNGPKTWLWEHAKSPYSFFGDLVSDRAIGKMGGAGTFLLIDLEHDLVIVYLTNYGQPENSLEGDESWNKFQYDIDVMGLCNIVMGSLN